MENKRQFVLLGGAGTIGRIVARDLFESHPNNHILLADYNQEKIRTLAESFKDSRVQAKFVDARQPKNLANLLNGQSVVINCLQHTFNLAVMEAALAAGVHYVDLGGLFSWTRKQLKLDKKFRDKELTAVIGIGCSPGITNLLASYVARQLRKVNSIKIRVGSVDFRKPENKLAFSYSPQTIFEELTLKPWIFRNGRFCQITPRTGWELTDFAKPVGKVWTVRTRHSEIATLPLSLKDTGLKHCDFKVGFDREFVKEVIKRLRSGWTIQEFNKLLMLANNPDDYEITRVVVDNVTIDCHSKAKPKWQASAGDIDTACPISIAAQMIATGAIHRVGVSPPEVAVPAVPFFVELEKRGMKIKVAASN